VRLQKADAITGVVAVCLCHCPHEHFMAEIRADDGHAAAGSSMVSQRQVACAGTKIKNWGFAGRWDEPGCPPAPVLIDVQAQQMIEQIVARRNLTEHPSDAALTLVKQRTGHGALAKR